MRYLVNVTNERPMLRISATIVLAFTCAAPPVLAFSSEIATIDEAGNWHLIDGGRLDGEGYEFQDLDGNGGLNLISVDNSFLYAFAPYAASNAPTRIKKVVGSELRDVTQLPQYRSFLRVQLQKMEANARTYGPETLHSNGYLAGWVAQKALVGEFSEAWGIMLTSFDRKSDWTTLACARPLPLDQCPEAEQKVVAFPEALAAHLVTDGYITSEEERLALASPQQTSVDANRRSTQQTNTKLTTPGTQPTGLSRQKNIKSTSLSQNEIDALRMSISHCWSPPPGIDARSSEYVVLRVLLKPDGILKEDPVLVEGTASPLEPALAVSAKQALRKCQPFTMLRPEHYDSWKDCPLRRPRKRARRAGPGRLLFRHGRRRLASPYQAQSDHCARDAPA